MLPVCWALSHTPCSACADHLIVWQTYHGEITMIILLSPNTMLMLIIPLQPSNWVEWVVWKLRPGVPQLGLPAQAPHAALGWSWSGSLLLAWAWLWTSWVLSNLTGGLSMSDIEMHSDNDQVQLCSHVLNGYLVCTLWSLFASYKGI